MNAPVRLPIRLPKPMIMGVINVTPDSFSDGGECVDVDAALRRASWLVTEGADIIDVGAESTRPGAQAVDEKTEWSRLEPILYALKKRLPQHVKISIDTYKPEIMLKAVSVGVDVINNISGMAEREVLRALIIRSKQSLAHPLTYLAMHMKGTPQNMQQDPLRGQAAVEQVDAFFQVTAQELRAAGFGSEQIWLDPGIGFGKDISANLLLIKKVQEWANSYIVAVGVSRKSFIGKLLAIEDAKLRDKPGKMLEFSLMLLGASVIRTHDIASLRNMRDLTFAI